MKEKQRQHVEMNNIITKIKYWVGILNCKLNMPKEGIGEVKNNYRETIQN